MPRYRVEINPDDYDDADDCGYATTVEAANPDEAEAAARRECEADNAWDEGYLTDDNCRLVECSIDHGPGLLAALKGMIAACWTGFEDSDDEDAPPAVKDALAAIAAAEADPQFN